MVAFRLDVRSVPIRSFVCLVKFFSVFVVGSQSKRAMGGEIVGGSNFRKRQVHAFVYICMHIYVLPLYMYISLTELEEF